MTKEEVKSWINQILMVLGPVSRFTETKVDDAAVKVLVAVADSDSLIQVVLDLLSEKISPESAAVKLGINTQGATNLKALMEVQDAKQE